MTPSKTRPTLRIQPIGQLGNQMFQFMLALSIRERVPDLEICGFKLPEWAC